MKKEKIIKVNLTSEEAGSITFSTSEKIINKITLDEKEYEYDTYETVLKLPEGVAKSLLRELKLNIVRN